MNSLILVFVAYFVLIFFIGWYGFRRTKGETDYWIAGGGLGWLRGSLNRLFLGRA